VRGSGEVCLHAATPTATAMEAAQRAILTVARSERLRRDGVRSVTTISCVQRPCLAERSTRH
jgi:hypothetical protein